MGNFPQNVLIPDVCYHSHLLHIRLKFKRHSAIFDHEDLQDDEEQGKKELKYSRISYLERAAFSTQAEYAVLPVNYTQA
ncbi:hypothetical protein ACFX13_016734 [Malus domestica]